MRLFGRLAVLPIVGLIGVLYASGADAQSFYTGSGNNMFRVFGCPALATLSLNGTGPTQQGDCTLYHNGNIVPAVPIETWILAQNEKLQRQVDELTARLQALEAATKRPPEPGTRSTPAVPTR